MKAPASSRQCVRFGEFELDFRSEELRKHGKPVKLQGQPVKILAILLAQPGELVPREALGKELWPEDTFVDFDAGLNSAIKKLREALGDSRESSRFIETLPRRGYRFIAPVEEAESAGPGPGTSYEPPVQAPAGRRLSRYRLPVMIGAGVLALLFIFIGTYGARWRERLGAETHPRPGTGQQSIRSIAVLPLENLSGDPAQDYFADGMTDALITELAQINSLQVISRTSTMRYKGTRKPLPDIAKELNVDGIVEGAVVRSGELVRVDAQLIQATNDRHVWASTYERSLGDVVVLQSEVARDIANAIHIQLTPYEQARLARARSVDSQTYELYLKGRYFWGKRTDESIQKSIDYFQQAIQRDPNYALAYAGLADAYDVRQDLAPGERFPKAKAAASTALRIDEGLAEAHTALANSLFLYDWDWPGAEKEFQRAIVLNPNYAWAHQWYGQLQHAMGRQQNWAAEVKRARELDPLSLALLGSGSGVVVANGQYDLAIERARKTLELDPNNPGPYLLLGRVYAKKGMYTEAVEHLQKGVDLSGGAPQPLSVLGYTYGVSGEREKALEIVQKLNLRSKRRYVSPYDIAVVYAGLGEKDLAFDWLQKAVADRSSQLVHIKYDEKLDTLHPDPRYTELLRSIGLPL
jgi:TolB-like protein/DNA-binding winged helix-turn-helix (wHTH) protein/Tfp pilus assembly protein PilF